MKINKKTIIVGCILILSIIILLVILLKKDKETILKCSSLTNNIEIKFKNNKPSYVSGIIKLKGIKDITYIKDNIQIYNNLLILDEDKKEIEYSFTYNEVNSNALNYIGLNYNLKDKYRSIRKQLENNNYYCK